MPYRNPKTSPPRRPAPPTTAAAPPPDDLRRLARGLELQRRQAEEGARIAALPVRCEHAAGLDAGDASHWVCVDAAPDGADAVREFPAHTAGLRQLVAWLQRCGVTSVALEATGAYGHVLFLTLLEAGFTTIMIPPQFARQIKGWPKTDRRDCQWISSTCTSSACCPASSGPTRLRTPCATTSANAPTWCVSAASTSNGCRRPWS